MTRYTVTAQRGTRVWVLQCVELPGALSEVARLDQADVIKEAIAFVAGVPEADVEYDLQPALDAHAIAHLDAAREARAASERLNAAAANELTAAARELHESGLSLRDVGYVLEVSHQRAQQLVNRPLVDA